MAALEFQAAPGGLWPALQHELQRMSGADEPVNDIIEAIASFTEGRGFELFPPPGRTFWTQHGLGSPSGRMEHAVAITRRAAALRNCIAARERATYLAQGKRNFDEANAEVQVAMQALNVL